MVPKTLSGQRRIKLFANIKSEDINVNAKNQWVCSHRFISGKNNLILSCKS